MRRHKQQSQATYLGAAVAVLLGSAAGCAGGQIDTGDCPRLSPAAPLRVSTAKVPSGYAATYRCDDGFTLVGSASRLCTDDTWDGEEPTCIDETRPTSCDPEPCVHGSPCVMIEGEPTCSQCEQGWTGEWCELLVDCGSLNPAEPLTVSAPNTQYGSVATYQCDGTGLVLVGAATRSCAADGEWTGAEPSCLARPETCDPNPCQNAGTCIDDQGSFDHCVCAAGWQGETCGIPVDCGLLTADAPLTVSVPTTSYLGLASYECEAGYQLQGAESRTCQENGDWSGEAPTCAPVDCGAPSEPVNGGVEAETTTLGSVATYTCDLGFLLQGQENRTCQADGSWSATAPTCAGGTTICRLTFRITQAYFQTTGTPLGLANFESALHEFTGGSINNFVVPAWEDGQLIIQVPGNGNGNPISGPAGFLYQRLYIRFAEGLMYSNSENSAGTPDNTTPLNQATYDATAGTITPAECTIHSDYFLSDDTRWMPDGACYTRDHTCSSTQTPDPPSYSGPGCVSNMGGRQEVYCNNSSFICGMGNLDDGLNVFNDRWTQGFAIMHLTDCEGNPGLDCFSTAADGGPAGKDGVTDKMPVPEVVNGRYWIRMNGELDTMVCD